MRVRITHPLSRSIDGIRLDRFVAGLTYDVGTTLANYLLAEGKAEPVESVAPALVVPLDDVELRLESQSLRSEAADRAQRRGRASTRTRK